MVMVGFVTLVMSRVTSIVSERSLLGFDGNVFSSPMVPGSSGALPGHSSTTRGSSAPLPRPVAHKRTARIATYRFIIVPFKYRITGQPMSGLVVNRDEHAARARAAVP